MRGMTSSEDKRPRFSPILWARTWVKGKVSRPRAKRVWVAQRFTAAITESFRAPALATEGNHSDTTAPFNSTAPLGTRLSAVIVLALFSICAVADSGSDIYKAHCSACHATSGAGDTMLGKNLKLRSLSSPEVQQQSDEQLFSITSKGKNRMPAYGRKLSQQQIEAVVKHIRSLKK